MATAKEILIKARDVLNDHGWAQGTYARDNNGNDFFGPILDSPCLCALGALCVADTLLHDPDSSLTWGDENDLSDEARQAITYLNVQVATLGARFTTVAAYNDNIASSKDEMLDIFDKTIASLEDTEEVKAICSTFWNEEK